MNDPKLALLIAKEINQELAAMNATPAKYSCCGSLYDLTVTNRALRRKTRKLFMDGHHARAVEEAYKLIDNLVKKKAGLQHTDLTGSKLMQRVFSANAPMLKLNEGAIISEQDEQSGYMQILSGCMTGIRNPRAHETDWEDTEQRALQLLIFANHLIERVQMSEKAIQ
jgi:uncharacterized protein (TIGR02391 family)